MLRDASCCRPEIKPRRLVTGCIAGLLGSILVLLAGCAPDATTGEPPPARAAPPQAVVVFDFETGLEGWNIPEWARAHEYYGQGDLRVLPQGATSGEQALAFVAQLPAEERWRGAWVEVTEPFDWNGYHVLSADVSLPADSPEGASAGLGLTTGDDWRWVQLRNSVPLKPGETATIAANIAPGSEAWQEEDVPVIVRSDGFRSEVRHMAVYVDFPPGYEGEVMLLIDNIRVCCR